MSCEKYLDLISARLDGELTAQEQAELDAHLKTCPACRAIADELTGMHAALTELGEVPAPAALSAGVLSKINAQRQADRRRFIRRLTTLAACLVLCVGVVRITDASYSDLTRSSGATKADGFSYLARSESTLADQAAPAEAEAQAAPKAACYAADDAKFKALPLSIDAYPLTQTVIDRLPTAQLLDSADGLSRFLTQFPNDDLSLPKHSYDQVFFLTNRLLAVVLQEPSSSITHAVSELTEDSVTLLRDTTVTGEQDHPRWLLLIPTQLDGPERAMQVILTDF